MKNRNNAGLDGGTLSPPAAEAFARVCKHGDAMLCYGILMTIAALAVGFGLEWGWTPLWLLGAVLLWIFGGSFSDARKLHSRAIRDLEAEERARDSVSGGLVISWQKRFVVGCYGFVVVPELTESDDVRSQAS